MKIKYTYKGSEYIEYIGVDSPDEQLAVLLGSDNSAGILGIAVAITSYSSTDVTVNFTGFNSEGRTQDSNDLALDILNWNFPHIDSDMVEVVPTDAEIVITYLRYETSDGSVISDMTPITIHSCSELRMKNGQKVPSIPNPYPDSLPQPGSGAEGSISPKVIRNADYAVVYHGGANNTALFYLMTRGLPDPQDVGNDYDSYLQKLEQQLAKKEKELAQISDEVSEIRQRSAVKLVSEIKSALNELNFLDVQFDMQFDRLPDYTANGIDAPEFLISTNPGEPLKPLGKVASGGELSRIMLGIKTIMAENDHIESLIFDEIDSGISGRTAQMVSEKMNELGRNHQIICITHLPQIAAMADAHFLIEKAVENKSTVSRIRRLTDNDSVAELARMLGGAKITDTVMESAREMKALAMEKKVLS